MVKWLARLAALLWSRTGAALIVLLVFTLTAFVILQHREAEPSYQNIPASVWLEISNTNQQKMLEGILAFQKMGPAGAEFLGKELVRKPSKLDEWLLAHHQSIPGFLKKSLLKPQRQVRDDTILRLLSGIHTNATPAMPLLIDWLESTNGTVQSRVFSTNANQFPNGQHPPLSAIYSPGHPALSPYVIHSNKLRMVVYPVYGNATIQTQVMVTAPGQVTTNYMLITRSVSNAIPSLAFELLRTLGSPDPRVIPLLFRPAENRYQNTLYPPPFSTNLKTAATLSVPLLAQKSASSNLREKLIALSLLKLALPESTAAKEVFIQKLSDPDYRSFDISIGALRSFTNDLDRIIPLTLDWIRHHPTASPKSYASHIDNVSVTIKEFARHSPKVIPSLEEILKENRSTPDPGIIQALGELGASNRVDLALLGSFTNHPANVIRAKAWLAIANLTGDADATAVYEMASKNSSAQWVRVIELGSVGTNVTSAVPILREALKNEEERLIAKAAESLGKIGPAAKDALPDLEALRNHPVLMVREPVEEAIRKISADPKAKGAE
jgi:hypothetical protein